MPKANSTTISYSPPIKKLTPGQEYAMICDTRRRKKITLKSLIETAEKEGKLLYQELYGNL